MVEKVQDYRKRVTTRLWPIWELLTKSYQILKVIVISYINFQFCDREKKSAKQTMLTPEDFFWVCIGFSTVIATLGVLKFLGKRMKRRSKIASSRLTQTKYRAIHYTPSLEDVSSQYYLLLDEAQEFKLLLQGSFWCFRAIRLSNSVINSFCHPIFNSLRIGLFYICILTIQFILMYIHAVLQPKKIIVN